MIIDKNGIKQHVHFEELTEDIRYLIPFQGIEYVDGKFIDLRIEDKSKEHKNE